MSRVNRGRLVTDRFCYAVYALAIIANLMEPDYRNLVIAGLFATVWFWHVIYVKQQRIIDDYAHMVDSLLAEQDSERLS